MDVASMTDEQMDAAGKPVVDMGPSARRARAGMAPEPGTADPEPSGPLYQRHGKPSQFPPNSDEPMANDSIAQMVATGTVLGPVGSSVRALHPLLSRAAPSMAIGAGEGAAGSMAMGGDPLPGAGIGAFLSMLSPMGRAIQMSKGGQARAFLDEQGAPVKPAAQSYGATAEAEFNPDAIVKGGSLDGMKAGEAVALLQKSKAAQPGNAAAIDAEIARIQGEHVVEPGLHPDIPAAQKDLEFRLPGLHDTGAAAGLAAIAHYAGHGSISPIALALLLARNAKPIAGRTLNVPAQMMAGVRPGAIPVPGQDR